MPFSRVTQQDKCPICDHPDWCMVSADGELAICPRVDEGSMRYIDGSGYLHRIKDAEPSHPRPSVRRPGPRYHIDAKRIAHECHARLTPVRLAGFASDLGVSTASLEQLMVGWHETLQAYTFPMRDGAEYIIGIRTRHRDGSKRAITGSKAGLFIPDTFASSGSLYICEGPTDTAAMLSVGLAAIGRPSCMGSHQQVRDLLNTCFRKRDVVIIADNDGPGREGAARLRDALGVGRLQAPPNRVKDVRERVREVIREFDTEDCDVGAHPAAK